MPMCYRAKRPLKIGDERREPGQLVPEAYTWPKVMALVHGGFLAEVAVPQEELDLALRRTTDAATLTHFGLEAPEPQVEVETSEEAEGEPAEDVEGDEEAALQQADLIQAEESEDELVEDDEPSLIETVAEAPKLSWPELRKEAKRLGLGRDATKADILAALEAEQK